MATTKITASGGEAGRRSPPLWRQLQIASRLVRGVREGQSLTVQLGQIDPQLRPGAQALSFHALRWLGTAEGVRNQLVRRQPGAAADALLCTALALTLPEGRAPYADFTLVDQAVEAANRDRQLRAHAGLLNACLRRYLRERAVLMRAIASDPVARWNHPAWWVDRLRKDHPDAWEHILSAAQEHPPMVLRVNQQRISVEDYLAHLAAAAMDAQWVGGAAIRLQQARAVTGLPGFDEGWVSVQSAAAQLAAPLLMSGLTSGEPKVLDACAAPGGKTAHLLELAPRARVLALEIDPKRGERITTNLGRLGLHAETRIADAAHIDAWWRGERFDAILVDAPCSASGIGSRHPDVRWLRRPSDIGELAARQDRLLNALWPLLNPGGRLLYATCSVFRQEGSERVEAFVACNRDARRLASPGHIFRSEGPVAGAVGDNAWCDDGFYYALLQKQAPI